MRADRLFFQEEGITGVSGLFSAYGSFGVVDGNPNDLKRLIPNKSGYQADYNQFTVYCSFEEQENHLLLRQDRLVAKTDLVLHDYQSRFLLENGDYEVYTQYNAWQHESMGGWQKLVTSVEVSNLGIRSTEGATPMIALRNVGNGKITVLHLLPESQWNIQIKRVPIRGKEDGILIEAGISPKGLSLSCSAGEEIEMPRLLLYQTTNSRDLDAWKLHDWCNKKYPRKRLPVFYNTWLSNFDRISVEEVCRQADCAAELGVEIFQIDAGWFGPVGDWVDLIGHWVETPDGRFQGKMDQVSEYIRKKGMVFGLWIEAERAMEHLPQVKEHPDWYLCPGNGNAFVNFANPEAVEYIYQTVCGLVDRYHIGHIKFDFNAPLSYDPSGNGFYHYMRGHQQLIQRIRQRYPQIHLTNCASGGARLDLVQNALFDSVWFSDNQSPVDALRIFCNNALRLPPNSMEKFDVRTYADGFPKYLSDTPISLPLSCEGATWSYVQTVTPAFTHAFLTGGPFGFSCNIADYPEEEKKALKEFIAAYKKDREFYQNAVVRILHDTDRILVLQYSDTARTRNILQVFQKHIFQHQLTIYPDLPQNARYSVNDQTLTGVQLAEDGIVLRLPDDYDSVILECNQVD